MNALPTNFIQEQLSWAYIRAVIFNAGYDLSMPIVDHRGIDGTVEAPWRGLNKMDFQLKATTVYDIKNSQILYDLRSKNYNQLTLQDDVPRALILFVMPKDRQEWLSQTTEELCLRHCAYWVFLTGLPSSQNTSTVRVAIPLVNQLNGAGLANMFAQGYH